MPSFLQGARAHLDGEANIWALGCHCCWAVTSARPSEWAELSSVSLCVCVCTASASALVSAPEFSWRPWDFLVLPILFAPFDGGKAACHPSCVPFDQPPSGVGGISLPLPVSSLTRTPVYLLGLGLHAWGRPLPQPGHRSLGFSGVDTPCQAPPTLSLWGQRPGALRSVPAAATPLPQVRALPCLMPHYG